MSSLDVNAGLALVNKWAAIPAEIQLSLKFNGIARTTLEGRISGWSNKRLSISGIKCEAFIDLSFVGDARDVIAEEGLLREGLSPESYSESVTFLLSEGEVTLVAVPRSRPNNIVN